MSKIGITVRQMTAARGETLNFPRWFPRSGVKLPPYKEVSRRVLEPGLSEPCDWSHRGDWSIDHGRRHRWGDDARCGATGGDGGRRGTAAGDFPARNEVRLLLLRRGRHNSAISARAASGLRSLAPLMK